MQFLGKFGKIVCWEGWRPPPPGEILDPPLAFSDWIFLLCKVIRHLRSFPTTAIESDLTKQVPQHETQTMLYNSYLSCFILYLSLFSGGKTVYQLPTSAARDPDVNLTAHVRMLGVKPSQSDGLLMGHQRLYYGCVTVQ